MKFLKEYIRKHPADNQILIRVPAGTRCEVRQQLPTRFHIECDRPVTKNSDSGFYMSEADTNEFLGEADE